MIEENKKEAESHTNVHWGLVLRHFRVAAGVSAGKAAESIGIGYAQYMKIERGQVPKLDIGRIETLADLFGIPFTFLRAHKQNLESAFKK